MFSKNTLYIINELYLNNSSSVQMDYAHETRSHENVIKLSEMAHDCITVLLFT